MFAIYNDNGQKRPITICNVKQAYTGVYFNARDRKTNLLLKRKNRTILWKVITLNY